MMKALKLQSEVLCVKLKKWSWIGLLMLCVTMLVGCQGHESRGYLEELSGKELSRVYPTENIEDLFEQFPNGFTVSQSRVVGDSTVFVYLKAKEKGKPFVGTMKQIKKFVKSIQKLMKKLKGDFQRLLLNPLSTKTRNG